MLRGLAVLRALSAAARLARTAALGFVGRACPLNLFAQIVGDGDKTAHRQVFRANAGVDVQRGRVASHIWRERNCAEIFANFAQVDGRTHDRQAIAEDFLNGDFVIRLIR